MQHTYRKQADHWHLFYNSESHIQEAAFGNREHFTITDEHCLELFMKDIKNEKNTEY